MRVLQEVDTVRTLTCTCHHWSAHQWLQYNNMIAFDGPSAYVAKEKKNSINSWKIKRSSVDINHHTCVSTQRVRMRLSGTHDPWPATAIRTRHFSSSLTATRQPGGYTSKRRNQSVHGMGLARETGTRVGWSCCFSHPCRDSIVMHAEIISYSPAEHRFW